MNGESFDFDSILNEFEGGKEEPVSEPPAQVLPVLSEEAAAPVSPETPETPEAPEEPAEQPQKKKKKRHRSAVMPKKVHIGALRRVFALLFAAGLFVVLSWFVMHIHPDAAGASSGKTKAVLSLSDKVNNFANNAKSDALGELAYIRKVYTIDRYAPCAPKPDPERFVTISTSESGKVMEYVRRARESGLLDGQEVIFSPTADFYYDSDIRCYCDDTILVICWKELIQGRVCSCVEVKIADPSQFRRKLVDDTFGSSVWLYNSQMAASVNAVTAMNADFYDYRDFGVVVYQGELCRFDTRLDVMFVDSAGNFSFMRRGEFPATWEEMQAYIDSHDIQFSLAFGPVLVLDGEVQKLTDGYNGLGEMGLEYSRAMIGQADELHYLYMAVNHSQDGTPRANFNQWAEIVGTKNLRQAYNFDGGQTSEVTFNGSMYNYVDWGNERGVSDIIYFGTAIPESEVSG